MDDDSRDAIDEEIEDSVLSDSSEISGDSFAVRLSELAADFLWLTNTEVRDFLSQLAEAHGRRFHSLEIFHDPIHKLEYHAVLESMSLGDLELISAELNRFAARKTQLLETVEEQRIREDQTLTVNELKRLYAQVGAADVFTPEAFIKAYERCLNTESLPIRIEETFEAAFRQKVFGQNTLKNLVIMQLVLGVPEPLVEHDLARFPFYVDRVESRLREEVTPLIDGWLSYLVRRALERAEDEQHYPPAPQFVVKVLLAEGLSKKACLYYILFEKATGTEKLIIESIAEIQGKAVEDVAKVYARVFRDSPEIRLPSFGERSLRDLALAEIDRQEGLKLPPAHQEQALHFRPRSERAFVVVSADDSMGAEVKRGDVLVLDPEIQPAQGDLVLASFRAASGEARTVLRRYLAGADFVQLMPDRLDRGLVPLLFRKLEAGGWVLDQEPAELSIHAVVVGLNRTYHPHASSS